MHIERVIYQTGKIQLVIDLGAEKPILIDLDEASVDIVYSTQEAPRDPKSYIPPKHPTIHNLLISISTYEDLEPTVDKNVWEASRKAVDLEETKLLDPNDLGLDNDQNPSNNSYLEF